MAKARVEIKGLQQLAAAFRQKGEEMQKEVARDATGVAAGMVMQTAQQLVPVRTGLLKSQLIVKRLPLGQAAALGLTSAHIVTARQGTKRRKRKKDLGSAPHAHLVELGTAHMPPQPFLRPALDQNVAAGTQAMATVIGKKVLT